MARLETWSERFRRKHHSFTNWGLRRSPDKPRLGYTKWFHDFLWFSTGELPRWASHAFGHDCGIDWLGLYLPYVFKAYLIQGYGSKGMVTPNLAQNKWYVNRTSIKIWILGHSRFFGMLPSQEYANWGWWVNSRHQCQVGSRWSSRAQRETATIVTRVFHYRLYHDISDFLGRL